MAHTFRGLGEGTQARNFKSGEARGACAGVLRVAFEDLSFMSCVQDLADCSKSVMSVASNLGVVASPVLRPNIEEVLVGRAVPLMSNAWAASAECDWFDGYARDEVGCCGS